MKRSLLWVLILVCTAGSQAAFNGKQGLASPHSNVTSVVYDATSFVVMLHRIAAVLPRNASSGEMTALRDSLPEVWTVSTAERTFSISTEPLRDELAAKSNTKAKVWVDHLAAEVESFAMAKAINTRETRAELDHILARPEFTGVRPPTPWELLRQRITAWLGRQLDRVFGAIGRHPIGGEILFWLIILAGVGGIALALIRFLANRDRMNALSKGESMVTARLWQEWIRSARQAANRGDFREAVHSAYWAGIVKLEDIGALPRDRTKTPREYLGLVAQEPATTLMPATPVREPLAALTSRLERVWYANRGAGPEDFRESLKQLEALGCRLE
jgi:Domain of unknown function (DUF4129)